MNDAIDPHLAAALRRAATELDAEPLPPALLPRVLAAATAARDAAPAPAAAAPRARALVRPWAWSGMAACLVVLVASALLMRPGPRTPAEDGLRLAGFVPLVPPERWPAQPAGAWLVSTELPSERLAALGLPYDPTRAGDTVRAELLLQPSGEVLAVRVIR